MLEDCRISPTSSLSNDRYKLADAFGLDDTTVVDTPAPPDAETIADVIETVEVRETVGITFEVPGAKCPLNCVESWHASLENLLCRQHRELEVLVEELLCGRRPHRKAPEDEHEQSRLTAHGAFQPERLPTPSVDRLSCSSDAQRGRRRGGSPRGGSFQTKAAEVNVGAEPRPSGHSGDHAPMLAEDAESSVEIFEPRGFGGGLGDVACRSPRQALSRSPRGSQRPSEKSDENPRSTERTTWISDDSASFHYMPRPSLHSEGSAGPWDDDRELSTSTNHTYKALARQEDEFARRDREFIRTSCQLVPEDEVAETSSTKDGLVGFLKRFLNSKMYEAGVVAFVMTNAVFTGWEVQSLAVRPDYAGDDIVISSVEMIFMVVFTLEMSIRLIAYRKSFFTGGDRAWNLMDLIIVVAMLADGVVSRAEESAGLSSTASNFRVVRILRMVRIVRVIRVLKFFSELRTLLTCILNCFWSLSWTLLVLLLMFYIFGLCLTQGCTDFFLLEPELRDEPKYARLLERFGSLDASVLSLFEAVADGVSWGLLVDVLSPLPWTYTVIFLLYIFVSIFAVLNIVTGVFVNGALTRAQYDRETLTQQAMHSKDMYLRDMQRVFNEMDTGGTGCIDRHAFQVAMRDERTRAFLDAHGLAWQDVNLLFTLIDRDGSGTIDCAEFMCGCLKFRGKARSLELAIVHFQLKWVMKNQGMLNQALSKCEALRDGFAAWRPSLPEVMVTANSEILRGLDEVYMHGTPRLPRVRSAEF